MAPKVTRLVVGDANETGRQLFSVVEKKNGELTIPINAAEIFVMGGTEKRVREHRYSIHPSPRSQDYTTIKQTVELENNEQVTTVSLTDAIKKRNGFSVIYVRRCQNMMNKNYPTNFTRKPADYVLNIPPYDPAGLTLFHGLFVGHSDSEFSTTNENLIIFPLKFSEFQLIVFVSIEVFPSADFCEFLHAVTMPPEANPSSVGQDILRYLMTGRSPENCVKQYQNSVHLLTKRFLTRMLPLLTDQSVIERVKAHIASIPDVTLTGLGLGRAPQLIDLLSDPKPPTHE